jgi:hypothetical protein
MSWAVTWTLHADGDLLAMHYETAAAIYEAVSAWVETGEGHAELVDGDRIRVLARGGSAILAASDLGFRVLRALPDNPLPIVVPLLDEPAEGDDD